MDQRLLAIYLNDHLGGATAGLELFRRASASQRRPEVAEALRALAVEVEQDRAGLLGLMQRLGVPVRRYKVWGGWALEKAGRLKPNGHLLSRSPLSDLVELEGLRLGVEGKACGFRLLRSLDDPRLDAAELDRLVQRATAQAEQLEQLRLAVGVAAFA